MKKPSNYILLVYKCFLLKNRTLFYPVLLLAVFISLGVSRLQTSFDIYDYQTVAIPSVLSLESMRKEFKDGLAALLVIRPLSPSSSLAEHQWCGIVDALRAPTNQYKVLNPFEVFIPQFTSIFDYRPLIPLDCRGSRIIQFSEYLRGSPFVGFLTDTELRDISFLVSFWPDAKHVAEDFRDLQIRIQSKLPPGFRLETTGLAASRWYHQESMRRDLWVHALIFILGLLFFRFFFGSWKIGFIFAGTIIFTDLMMLGLMGWTNTPVDFLNNSLLLMVLVAATEDFVYLLVQANEKNKPTNTNFMKLMPPSFWTSFTTMIGFGSLVFSPLTIIRNFGVWAAIGSFIEWIAVFFVLPVVLSYFDSHSFLIGQKKPWPKILKMFSEFSFPPFVGRLFILLLPLGFYGYQHINLVGDVKSFSDQHPYSQSLKYLTDSRGWDHFMSILFNENLSSTRRLEILNDVKMKKGVVSLVHFDQLADFLTRDLSPLWKKLAIRHFEMTSLAHFFKSEKGRVRYVLLARAGAEQGGVKDLIAMIRQVCRSDCELIGEPVVSSDLADLIKSEFYNSFFLTMLFVVVIIFYLSRRLSLFTRFQLMISACWGPLSLYAIIWLLELPINYISNMIGCILLGISGDSAIQFIFASGNSGIKKGLEGRAKASTMVFLLTMIGSLSLQFITIQPIRELGGFVLLGFALTYFGDLILLRSMIKK